MFTSIKQLFESVSAKSDATPSPDLQQLAAVALMIEVALADQSFESSEREQLAKTISKQWSIPATEVDALIHDAEQQVDVSVSLFEHTRLINEELDYPDKVQLLRSLWEIAFADGRVDHYEDHTIRRISDLIYVEHTDFIKTKLSVRDQFA
ncbi:TerB family tellurite resistance protein [Litorivicinus sp.]|nr:TerB family tellurite resistance protein [Litorivicinus sp.]MDC1207805.1 TerB family tellurite resistance protein [Litorivicinus sp.]MDC1239715.1 TerB family tellurite resistance protein [Litorivicinus sp.]MDC1466723.1 TerB family tellurite resistance protein [Litorivicinus sp.]